MSHDLPDAAIISEDTLKRKRKQEIQDCLKNGISLTDMMTNWTQCCYLMEKKKRLCNVARTPGSLYCGVHQPQNACGVTSKRVTKSLKHSNGINVERVPCPLDPSHSVYKHNLESHLKICNVTFLQGTLEKDGLYCFDCNSSVDIENVISDCLETSIVNADSLFSKIMNCFESIVEIGMNNMKCVETLRESASEDALTLVIKDIVGSQVSISRTRHAEQDAAILRLMSRHGLLRSMYGDDHNAIFVEFGAGSVYVAYIFSDG